MQTPEPRTIFPAEQLPAAITATQISPVVNALAFAPNGVLAVAREFEFGRRNAGASRASMVEMYDVERQLLVDPFAGDWPIRFSDDGTHIAMGSPDDGGVLIRDLESGAVWSNRENDPSPRRILLQALAFSPDGKLLATAGLTADGDGELALLDAATGGRLAVLKSGIIQAPVRALAFTPDSAFLVSGGYFDPIRVWDVAHRRVAYELEGHSAIVRSLAISPDGKTLATGSDAGVLKLWSLEQRVELLTLRAHERGVKSLQFSPYGRVLASAGKEGIVRLWRAAPPPAQEE